MDNLSLEIKIEGDSEGFVTFECPFCGSEFKLEAGEFQNEDNVFTELYCPYCGLVNRINTFYTKEVIEQCEAIAYNLMINKLNETFEDISRDFNTDECIKMDWEPLKKVNLKELKNKDTVEGTFQCPICGNHEKVLYCSGISKVYCSYCGVDL